MYIDLIYRKCLRGVFLRAGASYGADKEKGHSRISQINRVQDVIRDTRRRPIIFEKLVVDRHLSMEYRPARDIGRRQ